MTEQETYMYLAALTLQIQQEPDNAALFLNRAKVYVSIKDFAKALDDLDTSINLDANQAEAFLLRGQLRFQLHDKESAFEDLQKAAALDPTIIEKYSDEFKSPQAPKPFRF